MRSLPEWIEGYIRAFRAGVFCDAVLWDGLAETLSLDNAVGILNGLSEESENTLLERWTKQPDSFHFRAQEHFPASREIITQWCRDRAL
jgi:hypothetical protein